MEKNIRYKKDVKNRTELMLFLLFTCFTLCLSVGYAALNSDLKISGEASFRVESDIRITDVSLYETTNLAVENYTSKYSKDTITIGTKLTQVNSTISYKVKVQNSGTVSMWIDSIEEEAKNNSNTEYVLEGIGLKELINPGEEKEFIVKIKYKNNITTLPDNTNLDTILKFNFIKPESILASGSNIASTSTFFNGTLKKEKIESIEFRPTLDVIEDAIGSWDASASKNGTVIASYKDSDGNGLYELYIGGIGKVNTPSNSSNLFRSFNNLASINFDKYFDTSNTVNMNSMFNNCENLATLSGINNFNTSNVTSMSQMFQGCHMLETLDLGSFNTTKVTDMHLMFFDSLKIQKINLKSFDTSNVTNMGGMFVGNSNLISVDVSGFDTSNVTIFGGNYYGMFANCVKLKSLDVSNFNTSSAINMIAMFMGCEALKELDLSNFDTSNVTEISSSGSWNGMFSGCKGLEKLILTNFNTSNITNMEKLFISCSSLKELDLSSFDTSNVTNMTEMFLDCRSLEKINLSSFNTSKVTDMQSMFKNDLLLTSLDLSNFDTSNVTNMYFMFHSCKKLINLDLSSFDFSSVTNSSGMFHTVPINSLIYVKDNISKEFILAVRSDLTNVQIKNV